MNSGFVYVIPKLDYFFVKILGDIFHKGKKKEGVREVVRVVRQLQYFGSMIDFLAFMEINGRYQEA